MPTRPRRRRAWWARCARWARWAALVLTAGLLTAGCAGSSTGGTGAAASLPPAPAVDTTTGTVRGVVVGRTHQWRGVRYAAAPTGDRRWTLPVPAADTAEVLDASRPGPACPQADAPAQGTDEDCLSVDVTTPARAAADGAARPVVVWWHGGSFTSGSGDQYDAQRLADQGDVVVVTANYRLGMLGYLALPGLEGGGDFGLADQLAALRWAGDNAAAFGGDPGDVTVAGESAGAVSVCAALTSPAARGLLDRAVLSSGSCRLTWPPGTLAAGPDPVRPLVPLARAEQVGAETAAAAGCTATATPEVLACLRARPVDALVAQGSAYDAPLAFGTPLLPTDPAQAVAAGDVLDVPVLLGGNRDEQRAFVGGLLRGDPDAITAASYPGLVAAAFGDAAAAVLDAYPLSDHDSAPLAWSALVTDVAWACPVARQAEELAAAGNPVWTWEFADRTAPDVSGVAGSGMPPGAAHASDLPYLFDLGGTDLVTGPGQRALADTMVALWTSFARTGQPSAPGVDWPRTTADDAAVLRLDNVDGQPEVGVVDHRAEHRCALWESLGLV